MPEAIAKDQPAAVVAYVAAAVAYLVKEPKMALVEAWQENLVPSLGGSMGADAAKKLVAELHAKLANIASGASAQITGHVAPFDEAREQLAEAVDEASESASFDFGAD